MLLPLAEVSDYGEQTQFTLTTTTKAPTKAPTSSTELPDSTGPVLAQDRSDSSRSSLSCSVMSCIAVVVKDHIRYICLLSRASRGVSLPLIAVVSITVMVFVTAVIGAVYCRVKAQSEQSGKPNLFPETNGFYFKTEALMLCCFFPCFVDTCEGTRCESLKQDALVGPKQEM